jgi:arginine utilization protein RocB
MKKLLATALLLSAMSTWAASVKITSYYMVNSMDYLAELCGKVEGAATYPAFVNAIIDLRNNKGASYNTPTDENGNFCLAVITYRRTAHVSVMGQEKKAFVQAELK